jgi:hypothetical protein
MSLRLAATLAVLVVSAAPASAREEGGRSFSGTVGTSRIVLTLEDDGAGEDAWGSYFYLSSRLNIDLQGTRRNGTLALDARATEDHLELRAEGDRLVGTLTTAAKRHFPVRLARVTAAAGVPADAPADLSLHERLQIAGLTLEPGAVEQVDGKPIRWFRERKTGMRLFRLQGGYSAPAMAAMNAALAQNHWREVSRGLGCTDIGGTPGVEGDVSGRPWLGSAYVSYSWQANWSCAGAAHPDFGSRGYSFDARTGRALTLDAVLPIGPAPVPPENSDSWYSYRSKRFAPAVVALLRRAHPAEMKPVDPEGEDCNYADPDVWSFPAWRLTPQGLWLGASFARVMRACDDPEWSVLPWSALAVKPE